MPTAHTPPAVESPGLDVLLRPIARDDWQLFLILADEHSEKTPETWATISTSLRGGVYSPATLEEAFERLRAYLGEPPSSQRMGDRALYEVPVSGEQAQGMPFLNLGYHADVGGPPIEDLEIEDRDAPHTCHSALYRLWITREMLGGRDVVEVGSGRGSGASFVTRYYGPRSYIAVDGSRAHVAVSRELHAVPGLEFRHGLSDALPLPDESCDVVLNVESSHSYSDVEGFFAEVDRVLRPGGTFVLTDALYDKAQIFAYPEQLERHFAIERRADITANVVACMEAHGPKMYLLAQQWVPPLVAARIHLPLVPTGFSNYGALTDGPALYVSFLCRKPARRA